jgi:hypothetical protein
VDKPDQDQPEKTEASLQALEPLLAQLAELVAEALAPRLAAQLTTGNAGSERLPLTRRLLTVDELVALLPAGKTAKSWRNWFYQRTRHGQIPGCHKLAGRLFFDPDQTLPWLLNGAPRAPSRLGLDLLGDQSLHVESMADDAPQPRRTPGPRQ